MARLATNLRHRQLQGDGEGTTLVVDPNCAVSFPSFICLGCRLIPFVIDDVMSATTRFIAPIEFLSTLALFSLFLLERERHTKGIYYLQQMSA